MNKRIKIYKYDCAECPWESWDCMVPLMTKGSSRFFGTDYSNGGILKEIQEKATRGRVLRHQQKIAQILELDINDFKERGDADF